MRASSWLLAFGVLLGLLSSLAFDADLRKPICVGLVLASVLEWQSHRRRLRAVDPAASQAEFAVAMASGFLFKLLALVGVSLIAHFNNLFAVPAFVLAFLAAVLWGETCMVLLLSRTRPRVASQEDSPSPS